MSIEFRCPQCQKLLRVSDDSAGKQAKCPACGTVALVPGASTADTSPEGFSVPPPPPTPSTPIAGNPFATPAANPFAGGGALPLPPSDNPYAAPLSGGETKHGSVRGGELDIGRVFSEAWPTFKAHLLSMVVVYFVFQVISQFGNFVIAFLDIARADQDLLAALRIVNFFASTLAGLWLGCGADLFFLRCAKGESPPLSTLFSGHTVLLSRLLLYFIFVVSLLIAIYVPALLIGLIVGFATGVPELGFLVGFVVGALAFVLWVRWALTYGLAWYLVLDQPEGAIACMRISSQIMPGNRLAYFGLGILVGLLTISGLCAFLIGFVVTGALAQTVMIVAYMHLTGQQVRGYDPTVPPQMVA